MKVNGYRLTAGRCDGPVSPRAWRISTEDGVFWLMEDGTASHLVRLPSPLGAHDRGRARAAEPWAELTALAHTAETEAAGRWVRGGTRSPSIEIQGECP